MGKAKKGIDEAGIIKGITDILHALNIDVKDPNFVDTPKRVARAYLELFEGLLDVSRTKIRRQLGITFPCDYDEMVIVKNIDCWSMCPHHLLPVRYSISVGYLPNGKVLGLSKIPRLVGLLARRPIMQEQLSQDIIDRFNQFTSPLGVIVVVKGSHSCMQMRGVKAKDAIMVTSSVSGVFKDDFSAKEEFLSLIKD